MSWNSPARCAPPSKRSAAGAVETSQPVGSPVDVATAAPVEVAVPVPAELPVGQPAEAVMTLPADIDPAPFPPGQETKRLIRRMRRRNHAPARIAVLAFVAGLGALAWFHPTTRGPTRAAWQQIAGEAHGLIDRAASRAARR